VWTGERVSDLAAEHGVNRKTSRRRLDAAEHADAERARRGAETGITRESASEDRPAHRGEHGAPRSASLVPTPLTVRLGFRGVPLFPETDHPIR
jgi:hypothetical protein